MREGNKPDDLWVTVRILIAFARLGRLVYRRPCLASGETHRILLDCPSSLREYDGGRCGQTGRWVRLYLQTRNARCIAGQTDWLFLQANVPALGSLSGEAWPGLVWLIGGPPVGCSSGEAACLARCARKLRDWLDYEMNQGPLEIAKRPRTGILLRNVHADDI